MSSVHVGHYSNLDNKTGVSVFLFESLAPAVYLLCGSAPATRELSVLEPGAIVEGIHGLVLTGGSAFGLDAVAGVMTFLQERGRGFKTAHKIVPIVPAAAIYDCAFAVAPPTAEEAYQACLNARPNHLLSGRIGAGVSASVGKCVPHARPMSGGLGCATILLQKNIEVTAYAVVNCVGDVRDQQGNILAGARFQDGHFADTEQFFLTHFFADHFPFASTLNTTLVVVTTNAFFDKAALLRITRVASTGMARAISPVFTRDDGDLIFAISVGEEKISEQNVSIAAAEAVRLAILNAVKESVIL